jgi:hypothetical protein
MELNFSTNIIILVTGILSKQPVQLCPSGISFQFQSIPEEFQSITKEIPLLPINSSWGPVELHFSSTLVPEEFQSMTKEISLPSGIPV